MYNFDKAEIKNQLELEDLFDLLIEFNAEPEYTPFGIISATICHNPAGEGSRKLYYYTNSGLFYCYSGCEEPSFDIFELVRKVARLQWKKDYDLNDAVRWIAYRFGISGNTLTEDKEKLEDWDILNHYEKKDREIVKPIEIKVHDDTILKYLNYKIKLEPWLKEGISQEMIEKAQIGYFPTTDQITIPHFDKNGNFVGLRGRTMCKEEAELYGKYRPIKVNKKLYNHPLGSNLYGLNWNKEAIETFKTAVIFESEKSVLLYGSYFGIENNISVAACGSSISPTQVALLLELGVQEIVLAMDKQFQEPGDEEYKKWEKKLLKLKEKYQNQVLISVIWDTENLLNYKDSPIDQGPDVYLKLFKGRKV